VFQGGGMGRRVMDEQSGAWTYENLLIEDDFGVKSDVNDDGYDRDKTEGERP
jgi:hypothetical protein